MTILPKSEAMKRAIQWFSDKKKEDPQQNLFSLADKAAMRFNLSPKETDFLYKFAKKEE